MMESILIVDDEENILNLIEFNLKKEGYNIFLARTGKKALDIVKKEDVDLIILDIMLPEIDGYQVFKRLKKNKRHKSIPVVFLSAKDRLDDIVKGLDLGATDYLTKPFSLRELLSRIKAILRRVKIREDSLFLELGKIKLDIDKHEVLFNGQEIDLTHKEFLLLKVLLEHRGYVYSREELLENIWGEDKLITLRTIDVYIRNLRKKMKGYEVDNPLIETVRGVGYSLNYSSE